MVDADGGLAGDAGGEGQLLVVSGRGFVADLDFDHDEEDALPLEIGVTDTQLPKQLNPAYLEVLEEAAVMQIAHGVDFGVADAEVNRVLGHATEGNEP